MTPMKSFRRLALMPAVLACYLPLPAAAEIGVEHSGEVTLEASWYPETAAHAGQKDSFAHLEAKPELVIYGCLLYTSPSPRDLDLSRMPSSA